MNLVILNGYLTYDAEIKEINKDMKVLEVGIAVRQSKDKTNFFYLKTFSPYIIEKLGQYLLKGTRVNVECSLNQNTYKKDEKIIDKVDILINRVHLLSSPEKGNK